MSVLIVGGRGTLVKELVNKFHKENIDVFTIVGAKDDKPKYKGVFEQYQFSYDNENMKDIIQNIDPETVIFAGAYDPIYSWQDIKKTSMLFSSGLINILIACHFVQVKRFIFLSSHDVFEGQYEGMIDESAEISPVSQKALAIAQGEHLCKIYNSSTETEIIVLRLDHLYGIPQARRECIDFVSGTVLEAMRSTQLEVNRNNEHSSLYMNDAIEAIYRVSQAKEVKESLYHVSNETAINEKEVADIINKNFAKNVRVVEGNTDSSQKILSASRFNEEFHFRTNKAYESTIAQITQHLMNHQNEFLLTEERKHLADDERFKSAKRLFWALLPFIENILCFIPVFMINNRTTGTMFENLDFFVLYVLLFAIVFGKKQAIFSAFLSVAGYFFRQTYDRSAFELLIDYNTYIWMTQLFIVGMSVGHLKDSLKVIEEDKDEEIQYLNAQLDDIYTINSSNIKVKSVLENRIINYNDSLGKIYSITSQLDRMDQGDVLFSAAKTVSQVIQTDDVAVYNVANADYCRLFSATSEKAKSLGKSIKYTDYPKMLEAFEERKVFINKSMDESYPTMASALFDDDGKMQTIIMLWGLSFERMTIQQANFLTVLGYMIYNAVMRSTRYLNALENERFIPGTQVMQASAFMELVDIHLEAREEGLTDCTLIHINNVGDFKEVAIKTKKMLRLTDYLGMDEDGHLCILLPNSNVHEAKFVVDRLMSEGIYCQIQEDI